MKALVRGSAALLLAVVFPSATEAQVREFDHGPDVLEITGPVLVAFEKGLRTEIALREALRKQLAARTTKAEYDKCQVELMTSPESQNFNEAILAIATSVKPEELQPRMTRLQGAIEARTRKKCGSDPGYNNDKWTTAQLQAIERKAAAAAGPIP